MDDAADRTTVAWRPWGPAAFEEAADRDAPLLLSVTAHWCGPCRRMDATTYAEPSLAANVHDAFVPVRVDADRQPRVRERYNAGGFPSTVFLTPGGRVLAGGTVLDADTMRTVLGRVREQWGAAGEDAGRVPRAIRDQSPPAGPVTAEIEQYVAGQLSAKYDGANAGWGTDAKFPLPATVSFALKRERRQALDSLDAVARALEDDAGGFWRYAHGRDWSDPQREKLLDTNAALLGAYADAYLYTGADRYREVAERTLEYLVGRLWTGDGFGGSQAPAGADSAPSVDPPVDETVFADRNALAADALCRLFAYTDDERARRYAERTLDAVADRCADGVVSHFDGDASPTHLLADQARVAGAYTTAAQVLDPAYVESARAVADATVETLRDGETGAFLDGVPSGPGLLDRPLRPLDDNAAMADALVDLAALTGEDRYRKVAKAALGAFAGAADRMGVEVAAYATAAARVVDPPLTVAVADAPGSDLHRAALRVADHEKVVVPAAHESPAFDHPRGTAFVHRPDGVAGPADGPADLVALVSKTAE